MIKNKLEDIMKTSCDKGEITTFRLKVLLQLLKIPRGRVSTYALLAESIKCNSAQAIGQALKLNPWAPEVPCHRIIKSNYYVGGFQGHSDGEYLTKKIKLLADEGVSIDKNGLLSDLNKIYSFKQGD